MAGDEHYVEVDVVLKAVRPKSVLVASAEDDSVTAWIGRSTIDGTQDSWLDHSKLGEPFTLRVMEWVARKNGLL